MIVYNYTAKAKELFEFTAKFKRLSLHNIRTMDKMANNEKQLTKNLASQMIRNERWKAAIIWFKHLLYLQKRYKHESILALQG